MSIFRIL